MSYLGNAPARSFISFERQVFTIVNSQTAYALSHSVTNENDIRLVVNNVVQEPGSGKAYTATGTALTLSAALTNGTDEMYCVFLGRATATNAPGAGSVGTVQLADLNVTSGKIANDAVTLAKMASGTDGNIISYDASGNPVAVATGSAGQFLKSAGAGAVPSFATIPAGSVNTPAFEATISSEQNPSSASATKINFDSEVFDVGGVYNTSNKRFTPGVAGKYFIYCNACIGSNTNSTLQTVFLQIYKNGSQLRKSLYIATGNYTRYQPMFVANVIDLDTDDYIEMFTTTTITSGTVEVRTEESFFGAYKIIE